MPSIEPISTRYGLKFGSVRYGHPSEGGISKILGIDSITGGDINAYQEKARKCLDQIQKYDIVYVHIKGPDEFGHDGDANGRKRA